MELMGVLTLVLPLVALFCVAFTIYAIRSLDSPGTKILLTVASIILVILSGILLLSGQEEESLEVSGIKKNYRIDDSSQVHITGKLANVRDYNKLKITVLENGKPAADNVITTVFPSKNRLKVSYTSTRNENSELRIVVTEKKDTVAKKIDVKRSKKELAVTATSTTGEDKEILIKGNENRLLSEQDVSTFTQEAKETTKRFNKEVREGSLAKIEINPNEGMVIATMRDAVQMLGYENKKVLAEELGTRIIGLYRGTIIKSNTTEGEELPIKVVYEDGSLFGKSTKEEPKKIVPEKNSK